MSSHGFIGAKELVYNLTMKRVIVSLVLLFTVLFAEKPKTHKHLPYETLAALLQGIEKDAIIMGTGRTKIYVFVDPLCPHSRKFMTMVSGNKVMLSKYRYYIYLYSIPRLHSEAAVSAIYASRTPAEQLLKVMVAHEAPEPETDASTGRIVSEIAAVAERIDVYKRPYLIVAKAR